MRHSGVLLGLLLGAVSGGHMAAAADDDNITMLVWRDNAVCAHNPDDMVSIAPGTCTLLDLGIPGPELSAVKLWCSGGLTPEVSIDVFQDSQCQRDDKGGQLSGYCYRNARTKGSFVFTCDAEDDQSLWQNPISAILCAMFVGICIFAICRWQRRYQRRRRDYVTGRASAQSSSSRPYRRAEDRPGMTRSFGRDDYLQATHTVQATAVQDDAAPVVVAADPVDLADRPSMQQLVSSVMSNGAIPSAQRQSRIMEMFHAHAYAGDTAVAGREAPPASARREGLRTPLLATPVCGDAYDVEGTPVEGIVAGEVTVMGGMAEGVVTVAVANEV